jgi:hypothetical protein
MGQSELGIVVDRAAGGDEMAGDLLGEAVAEGAKCRSRRPVEVTRLDVVGKRRLRRPRRTVIALRAWIGTALRAWIGTALRAWIGTALRAWISAALRRRWAAFPFTARISGAIRPGGTGATSLATAGRGIATGWWHDISSARQADNHERPPE